MGIWKHISLQVEDGVATIRMERPPLNIMNVEMMGELLEALDTAKGREVLALIIRSGIKGIFSAGADVREHLPETAELLIHKFEELVRKTLTFSRPTISVVEGTCLGGGMELAVACDFVLATDKAVFGQPEINVGVYPPAGAALYPRLIGLKNAYRLILTGRSISAGEAHSMGLATLVVKEEELELRLRELLDELKSKSGAVMEFSKKAMYECLSLPVEEALRHSSKLYLEGLMRTEDAVEGLNAFLQKRKPIWKHR